MNAGSRRHLVTFQTPGEAVADGDGQFTQVWTALPPDEWVSILSPTSRGMERRMAGTVLATATHVVGANYRSDVDTTCRILVGVGGKATVDADGDPTDAATQIFNITGKEDPEQRRVEMFLACVEDLS